MTRQPLLRSALALSLAAFLALIAYAARHAIDHRTEAEYSRHLRLLKVVDARLNEELLRSRSGLAKHYDGLVRHVREIGRLLEVLGSVPAFLGADSNAIVKRELAATLRAVEAKRELIEQFKMHNAVLRNSLRFLPIVVVRLKTEGDARKAGSPAVIAAQSLVSTVLLLDVAPDRDGHERLDSGIAELERLHRGIEDQALAKQLGVALQHARVIARHQPKVDALVREILEAPVARGSIKLEDAYFAGYKTALDSTGLREKFFFGLAVLIVVLGLTDVILRVHRSNAALASTTQELRKANEALASEREKERELGELKTRFVSMTSHEFRTPLSAILSSSELLSTYGATWDRERTLSHFERIQTSARNMSEMLDEVLLIGRAEAGALRPQAESLDLSATCRRLIGTLEQTFGDSHPFRFELSGETRVHLDERLVTHVLSNLLENAVKYSPLGSEIDLTVFASERECRFLVRDRGIGIPEADIPRLFQSFERGRNVGHVNGTGLGLAVVKRVLDVQGGSIEVKSELGRGSEFMVTIPWQAPSAAESAGAS